MGGARCCVSGLRLETGRGKLFPKAARAVCSVLALVLSPMGIAAAADLCPTGPKPTVELIVDQGRLRHDHQLSQPEIEALFFDEGASTHGVLGRPVGLTRTQVSIDFQTKLQPFRMSNGSYCLWLDHVVATVRYVDTTIYVDRKYRKGSCQFSAILDHEHQHVEINRATLQRFAPRIRDELKLAVQRINPVVVDEISQGREYPIDMLQSEIDPVLEAFNTERELANSSIDTPDSYRHTLNLCRNW